MTLGTEEERRRRAEAIKGQVNKAGEAIKNQKKKWDEEQIKREAEAQVRREAEEKARQAAIEKARLEMEERIKNGEEVVHVDNVVASSPNPTNPSTNQSVNNGAQIRDYDPSMDYNPISMWGYFGYGVVFMLPLIGWMIALVFAVGGTSNINLRNFARSQFCIAILTCVIFFFTVASFVNQVSELEDKYNSIQTELREYDGGYW